MREHGAPAVDQSVGEGVAQEGWGLAGFGVGEQPQESCGFITPTSSNFNPKDNKATSLGTFLVPARVSQSCASVLPSPHSWLPGSCEGKPRLCQPLVAPLPTVGGRWRRPQFSCHLGCQRGQCWGQWFWCWWSLGLLLPCKFWLLLARGGLLGCVRSLLGHKLHGGRQGVKSATAPAETAGQGKWASKTSKEDGCECSAGVRAGLGFEQCTAGWIEAFEEFLMATGVDGGGRLVLPSLPDVGSVVGVLRWCWWPGFREGYPFRWLPSMCCQWICWCGGGLEGWYGWVLKLLEEGCPCGGRLLLEDGDGICPMGGLCL